MSIKIRDLNYTYMRGTPYEWQAIRGVSVEIAAGTITGVVGNTGAGKSTLLKLIAGLLVADSSEAVEAQGLVGVAFQFPEQQLFAPTVAEDILYGADNYSVPRKEAVERMSQLLEAFGLPIEQYGELSPFALSGGEQRKVALAGILIYEPEIILLDEPFAGLDMTAVRELTKIIKELQTAGKTVIIVSHSMDRLAGLADRILIMNDGQVVADATPEAIFAQPELLVRNNLEVPILTKLIQTANIRYGLTIPLNLYELAEIEEYLQGSIE
jgi:energy-coupling factor transport system ATP-binding protein